MPLQHSQILYPNHSGSMSCENLDIKIEKPVMMDRFLIDLSVILLDSLVKVKALQEHEHGFSTGEGVVLMLPEPIT
jgi:hypothetical protein